MNWRAWHKGSNQIRWIGPLVHVGSISSACCLASAIDRVKYVLFLPFNCVDNKTIRSELRHKTLCRWKRCIFEVKSVLHTFGYRLPYLHSAYILFFHLGYLLKNFTHFYSFFSLNWEIMPVRNGFFVGKWKVTIPHCQTDDVGNGRRAFITPISGDQIKIGLLYGKSSSSHFRLCVTQTQTPHRSCPPQSIPLNRWVWSVYEIKLPAFLPITKCTTMKESQRSTHSLTGSISPIRLINQDRINIGANRRVFISCNCVLPWSVGWIYRCIYKYKYV